MNLLAVNLNYLGDALFTTPALSALRARFPGVRMDVLAGERAAAMLDGDPAISRLLLRPPHRGMERATVLRRTLAEGDYDAVVLFQSTLSNALLTYLRRVPVRVGFAQDGCGPFLTHPVVERGVGEHIVDAYVRLAEALTGEQIAAQAASEGLRITVAEEDARFAEAFLKDVCAGGEPVIGLVIGATRPQKRWFEEYFARLADLLHTRLGASVLLLGGPDETASAARIARMCRVATLHSAIGKTTEKQLAAISARLSAIVSGDSGPLHIATAVRTPVVALFGSTDPADTGPWQPEHGATVPAITLYDRLGCAPCRKSPTCGGTFDCLWTLTPERVFDAVYELVGANRIAVKPAKYQALPVTNDLPELEPRRVVTANAFSPASVLVITKHHFMGDAIVTVPLLRAVRQIWGNTRLSVLTGAAAATVLEGCPYTDKIIAYNPKQERGYLRQIRFLREVEEHAPEMCLVVDRSFRTAVLAAATGAQVRAGFAVEYRSPLLTHPVGYKLDRREIECCLDILRVLVADAPGSDSRYDPAPELWITGEERQSGRTILQDVGASGFDTLIGFQPGATFTVKQWDTARFAAVADALTRANPGAAIVLFGGRNEMETAKQFRELVSPKTPVFDLTGTTSLRETMATLSYMSLFISNDTGVAHIAAGLRVPLVTLFGATIAHKWGNYGAFNAVIRADDSDLTNLSPEQVTLAATRILAKVRREA
ncbi:MAG: lipopolysaccharide heptosyltransferase II [Armatimonadetes bacterium]|nr:lipopolysaccharide heptosyltransferase II [Armatimonadota bacterium]